MSGELAGKVAIVTGSGRGIGEAAIRELAHRGAKVVVNDIDADVAAAVAADLGAEFHASDLTQPGACDQLVQTAIDNYGQLDIVVNNAGYAWDAPLHKVTDEQLQAMLDIHTIVPFRVLRAAAPHMREAAKRDLAEGREVYRKVVNVISLAGVMGNAGQTAYAAAKAGAVGLTKSLAKEWGALRINVNAVAFGLIETRMTADLPDAARTGLAAHIPLGRGASPEEAARGIVYLCGPGSDYVQGQVLPVSGGLSVGMSG
jgi:3-oxoacyl-[acyl-carrier protein] reductase